jgi:hypothetical protein
VTLIAAGFLVLVTIARAAFPTDWWFDARSMAVQDVASGAPVVLSVDRIIRRPFVGQWSVNVRRATDSGGWEIICAATGGGSYRPDAALPEPLTLDWWTNGQCTDLPPGQMYITTVWWLDMVVFGAIPTPALESNVFTVAPEAAQMQE